MSPAFAPTITSHVYFSRYHLHAARFFRDQVAELEKKPFSLAHRSQCVASVTASAYFLEALINEAFHGAAGGFGIYCGKLPTETRERVALIWELTSKPSVTTLERFGHFVRCCGAPPPDKGAEPWQSAAVLFELRNALVHAQPIDTGAGSPVEKLEKKLKSLISVGRGYPLNPQFPYEANPFFPDRVLGHGCCCWAVDSAEALARWFATATRLEAWWEPPVEAR